MIKKLIAFVAMSISLSASATLVLPEWRFSEEGLLQSSSDENLARRDAAFTWLASYQTGALPSAEPVRGLVSSCDLDSNDWCNQHSRRKFSPIKNEMAYSYEYSHYTIANWPIKNNPIPVAEPVAVLLLFIGFVLLFLRGLRNRMKERYVHKFPVIF